MCLTGPSEERIRELKDDGYSVREVHDLDPPLYGWFHRESGASQGYFRESQPYRRTKEQAWDDCHAYVSGDMPLTPNPDWAEQ